MRFMNRHFSALLFARAAALAAAAFLARATRCSAVSAAAEAFPPSAPNLAPFAPWRRKYSRISGGSFFVDTPVAYAGGKLKRNGKHLYSRRG